MEFATGAMGTLVPKLGKLLEDEYHLQKSLKQGIKDLRDELLHMQAALEKVHDFPLDQLDPQVKLWANDVRELSYSIEDSLDSFMVRVEGFEATEPHTFVGFIKKACSKVTKLKIRHRIASDIKKMESKVRRVKELHERYKVDPPGVANLSTTMIDPRLTAMYREASDLVGIDKAMDEVIKMLSEGNDERERKLKIISVVGFGGLGKTSLIKAVYAQLIKEKPDVKNFDCGGFVPVGQKPDVKKVFKEILYELDKKEHENIMSSQMNERQLIDKLREFLNEKRYLIVLDDVWDIPTWEIIKHALVDSKHGSRIIITTRICEVAKKVGDVYNMKPLSYDHSKELLHTRIFGGKGISPNNQSIEASERFLRKCGGVPLSIITIASLLVSKRIDDWSKVYDSIGFGHEDNEVVQNTRKIISFSYYDLPSCLKTCLLYLSIYPEDSFISKELLIWKWVAQDFIPKEKGVGLFKLGEIYFNELINRSMIQWSRPTTIFNYSGCRVHGMVLDLIRTLSSELNFVTIHDAEWKNTCSQSRSNIIRRLVIHDTSAEHIPGMEVEHVRSFNAMMCPSSRMPPLMRFKVLRVLELENCDFSSEGCRLEHLGKLLQLRYLGLCGTPIAELPREIENLKLLQTLQVEKTGIKELPSSVSELRELMYLAASMGTIMMGEIGKLTSLEKLKLYSVDKSPNFLTDLGKLTEVRDLFICLDEIDESVVKTLVESLCKLRKIHYLSITLLMERKWWPSLHGWEDWAPPSTLHHLLIRGFIFPRMPSWIDSLYVPHLSYASFMVKVLEVRDMQILGRLPSLYYLFLGISEVKDSCRLYTVGNDEFKNLGHLIINMDIICGEGALPMLLELDCYASVLIDVGLARNMPLLEAVTYWVKGCSAEEVGKMSASLSQAAKTHPNHPLLKLYIDKEGFSSTDQEKEDGPQEISGSDEEVRRAVTYLKEVLNVSEEVSATDEEIHTVAYLRHVLHASEKASDEVILTIATYLKDVLHGSEEVLATDEVVRGFAAILKDVLHVSMKVSVTDKDKDKEEVSLADVRTVATYLKGVLHASEEVSATDQEVPTLSYLRHVLHAPDEWSDIQVCRAATYLKDVSDASEEDWATDQMLRSAARHFRRHGYGPWKEPTTEQEPSDKVEAAVEAEAAMTQELEADLNRLTLDNKQAGETHSTGTSAEGPGPSHS